MGKKLLRLRKKIIFGFFFSLFIALSAHTLSAQTVLSSGDLAIVTVNLSANSFNFIPLIDLKKSAAEKLTNNIRNNSETVSDTTSATLAFASANVESQEGDNVVNLTVELVEAGNGNTVVEADIVFVQSSSSASVDDIGNFSTQTVTFGPDANTGDTKSIAVEITDDDEFEGEERAVFQLDGLSAATVADPAILNLIIQDNDRPGPTINIEGSEGWRMITVPPANSSFLNALGEFRTQGLQGSGDPAGIPSIYTWNVDSDNPGFEAPVSMSEVMKAGKGYIVYFFEDEDPSSPGIQGGFPKEITLDDAENSNTVNIEVSASDQNGNGIIDHNEGWNLLGNPFDVGISVTELLNILEGVEAQLNSNIYVWDKDRGNGNGGFTGLSEGDRIEPFQAFFVKFKSDEAFSETVTLNKNVLQAEERSDYNESVENNFGFSIELGNGTRFDEYSVVFSDEGRIDSNLDDVLKLYSLNSNSINLYSRTGNDKIQQKILPKNLDTPVEIPLGHVYGEEAELTFRWNGLEELPRDWTVTLIDRSKNIETNLNTRENYSFVNEGRTQSKSNQEEIDNEQLRLNRMGESDSQPRFVLAINPGTEQTSERESSSSVKLNPNYPNPFNSSTTISFELTEQTEVSLTIWNMIGQKVATLVDGTREAGEHTESWNANNMPSGMYIAQLEVNGRVFIRKMTLIK